MPLHRLEWSPGFNSQATQTKNRQGWFAGNLVRWRLGLLEKLAGWQQLFATAAAGIVRALHAYEDLLLNVNLFVLGDGGAQIYIGGTLYTLEFNIGGASVDNANFVTTMGIKTVEVDFTNLGAVAVGTPILTEMTLSLGGFIIPPGTTFSVLSVTAFSGITFDLASNATRTDGAGPSGYSPSRLFTLPGSGTSANVLFHSHGLSNGQFFTTTPATSLLFSQLGEFASFTIPANTTVGPITVVDADNFTFDMTPYGSSNFSVSIYEGQSIVANPDGSASTISTNEISLIGQTPSPPPAAWFADNLGTNGVVVYTGSPIWIYNPPIGATPTLNNAAVPNPDVAGSGAPQINAGAFVAMPQAQIIAFGSEVILGSLEQDPLLIRFSDAGSYTSWTASATNQAGSFHLGGSGTKIVGGFQAPQTSILWTNNDIWSMLYVGTPFIYSFTVIASQCGLIAPHAFALIGRTTWWMSTNTFFTFSDSGIAPIECPVWDIIFGDLDQNNLNKIFLGASQSTNEVWAFYPSKSGGLGECDKYVKVNILENLWDYGSLQRSAWLPENAFGFPLGAETNTLLIQQHEIGYDANGQPMTGVYAETGYADIGDGEQIMYVDEFIQDMKWFGSEGAALMTLYGVNYPGDSPIAKGPYGLDSTNRYIRPDMRARQIALRFDWAPRTGFSARLGTPRIRAAAAGTRP